MTTSRWLRRLAVVLVALTALAACGDDGGEDGDDVSAGDDTEETTTTTEATTTTTMSPEEAEAAIAEVTAEFFRLLGEGDQENAAVLMENGSDYIDEMLHCEELTTGAGAELTSATFDETGESATTIFAISLNGAVVLEEAGGGAVLVDGEWLISENTFLSLYDAAKDGCTGPPPAAS